MSSHDKIEKYGITWTASSEIEIERQIIRHGGYMAYQGKKKDLVGTKIGNGLLYHFKEFQRLAWPEDDVHRWSDLVLKNCIFSDVIGIMGPGDAGKTWPVAKFIVTDYLCNADDTLTVVCTTEERGSEQRIFGAIKELLIRAQRKFPGLPGIILEASNAIVTDDLKKDKSRSMKKGILWVPCSRRSNDYSNVKSFVGFKQKRMRLVADEAQFLGTAFLDALANYFGKEDVKAIIMGNPVDPMDCLGQACEPVSGWDDHPVPEKTAVWQTKWMNGVCLNLVGCDSPNFDYPEEEGDRFPYLTGWKKMHQIEHNFGRDSIHWYSQFMGVMRAGLAARRVLTMKICENNGAFDGLQWKNSDIKRVYFLDAAYSGVGGDRCAGGHLDFGACTDDVHRIMCGPVESLSVSLKIPATPEDQIAEIVFERCQQLGIPGNHVFYDDTGRGTLGTAFARKFGHIAPVAIAFGGRPTNRPVRYDLKAKDKSSGQQRHIRCDEYYSKFVSELWFSARYAIEGGQVRGLPKDVAKEGCMREYKLVAGNKIEVEPKDDMKERLGRSPDYFDAFVTGVEGARRLGFKIQWAADVKAQQDGDPDIYRHFSDLADRQRKLYQSKQLQQV